MLPFMFRQREGLRILCLGAHCDDIEIGCGGTLMRFAEEYTGLNTRWVVFTSNPDREAEARESADHFLGKMQSREVVIHRHRDGFLPYEGAAVKTLFEDLKAFQPDVIFTHFRDDLHQDHRLVSELTWNTFRDHLVLEYEIPKYDGDLGNPNLFVPLPESIGRRKVDALERYFATQRGKHWFEKETFLSLMRLRGLQSATRYAEGFYLRKAVM